MSVDIAALVASPHFRFMEGMPMRGVMIPTARAIVVGVHLGHVLLFDSSPPRMGSHPSSDWLPVRALTEAFRPDPDHWRFAGCLLHLVREAWAARGVVTISYYNTPGVEVGWAAWLMEENEAGRIATRPTEVECLEAALLAAPPKVPS